MERHWSSMHDNSAEGGSKKRKEGIKEVPVVDESQKRSKKDKKLVCTLVVNAPSVLGSRRSCRNVQHS